MKISLYVASGLYPLLRFTFLLLKIVIYLAANKFKIFNGQKFVFLNEKISKCKIATGAIIFSNLVIVKFDTVKIE